MRLLSGGMWDARWNDADPLTIGRFRDPLNEVVEDLSHP
jgi:hypothetical protein